MTNFWNNPSKVSNQLNSCGDDLHKFKILLEYIENDALNSSNKIKILQLCSNFNYIHPIIFSKQFQQTIIDFKISFDRFFLLNLIQQIPLLNEEEEKFLTLIFDNTKNVAEIIEGLNLSQLKKINFIFKPQHLIDKKLIKSIIETGQFEDFLELTVFNNYQDKYAFFITHFKIGMDLFPFINVLFKNEFFINKDVFLNLLPYIKPNKITIKIIYESLSLSLKTDKDCLKALINKDKNTFSTLCENDNKCCDDLLYYAFEHNNIIPTKQFKQLCTIEKKENIIKSIKEKNCYGFDLPLDWVIDDLYLATHFADKDSLLKNQSFQSFLLSEQKKSILSIIPFVDSVISQNISNIKYLPIETLNHPYLLDRIIYFCHDNKTFNDSEIKKICFSLGNNKQTLLNIISSDASFGFKIMHKKFEFDKDIIECLLLNLTESNVYNSLPKHLLKTLIENNIESSDKNSIVSFFKKEVLNNSLKHKQQTNKIKI